MTARRPRGAVGAVPDAAEGAGGSDTGGAGAVQMRPQRLALSPVYRHLRDSITRPHLRLTESRYFWERWKPRLGPDAAILVMEVRDRCNRSLATGPGVDGAGPVTAGADCTVGATELAAACGFSRVTLWRILQREEVRRFVWVEHNYVYDQSMGKKRRTISTYHVLMEDPLVEEDEAYVQSVIAGNGAPAARSDAPTVQVATVVGNGPRPRLQRETEVPAPTVQSATTPIPFTVKPGNVHETNLNKRLPENERGRIAAVGDVVKQGGLDDPKAFVAALLAQTPAMASRMPGRPAAPGVYVASPGRSPQGVVQSPFSTPDHAPPSAGSAARHVGSGNNQDFAPFIEQAERVLGDRHSRGFYVTALRRLHPDHMHVWHRALGLASEQPPETIRRSRGALFTSLLRSFATAAGVALGPVRATSE